MAHANGDTGGSLLERAMVTVQSPTPDDPTSTRLLDAAYHQFCRHGIARSSLDEIARAAGLSRVTIYRKFHTKDALVDEVILRELRRYFDRFRSDVARGRTAEDRLVIGFVSSIRTIGQNPLIGTLLDTESGRLFDSISGEGTMLAAVRQFVAGQLRREQERGAIPPDLDTERTAEMLARVTSSFLTTPSTVIDTRDDDELAAIARTYLVPMLSTGTATP